MAAMILQFATSAEDPREAMRHELGLDVPIHVQYGRWMAGIVRGDLGKSLWTSLPILETLLERLPVSLEVGILAILISLMIALPVGIYSGIRPETLTDHLLRSIAIFCICVPNFWLGTMILIYPAMWWKWSPPMFYVTFLDDPITNLRMVIIPAVLLGMWLSGVTMRLTRTMVLEVLRQDYVRTAWAKGLEERVVVLRHVLKNSLIPLITMVGLQLPVLIGGAVVVEYLFGLPGLGSLIVRSLEKRDYPIVSGANLFMGGFVLVINLVIDLTYAWLDPRIRYK
jgi:peptide/nickel transport system permease protein